MFPSSSPRETAPSFFSPLSLPYQAGDFFLPCVFFTFLSSFRAESNRSFCRQGPFFSGQGPLPLLPDRFIPAWLFTLFLFFHSLPEGRPFCPAFIYDPFLDVKFPENALRCCVYVHGFPDNRLVFPSESWRVPPPPWESRCLLFPLKLCQPSRCGHLRTWTLSPSGCSAKM